MRALCGSIITAGALIGLGLCAVGLGMRYQHVGGTDPSAITHLKWIQIDTPMMLLIVALLSIAVVGLATAFLGLAYHHERRHYERHSAAPETRSGVLR
jgi:cell division protein FtsX